MRYSRRRTPLGVAREEAVKVATVRQIARSAAKTMQIDNRYTDHGTLQGLWVEVVDHTSDDFNAVKLIAVDSACQTQDRALFGPIDG
jgi:hypothetical protein